MSNEDVWIGWEHLFRAQSNLYDAENGGKLLDVDLLSAKEVKTLEIIKRHAPELLPVTCRDVELAEHSMQVLLSHLGDDAGHEKKFIRVRRFLEIIEAGNLQKRFKIKIAYLPAPLPDAPPSPFQQYKFEAMIKLQPMVDAFNKSLSIHSDQLSAKDWWGRCLLSAVLYGGLLKPSFLLLIPDSLKYADSQLRWLDLSEAKNETDKKVIRRWHIDPLTRLLLLEGHQRVFPPFIWNKQSYQVMRLIKSYASRAGFEELVPRNLTLLTKAVSTKLHLYLPPYLVHYVVGSHDSASLPIASWQRLILLPTNVASDVSKRGSENSLSISKLNIKDNEVLDKKFLNDDEAWPAQLKELVILVRKDEQGMRDRINNWLKDNDKTLLTSIKCLGEWIVKRLLTKGRGRRPLRQRTIYAMLNCIGNRLVSQLGKNDPATLEDTESYIELYSTALEDSPSIGVRRRVAHALKSFHEFLVENHEAPSLDGSGIFAVYGKKEGTVDANIIGIDTFFMALQFLNHQVKEQHNTVVAQVLCRIAGLGFFAGLRRSEAIGLKISDLEGDKHVNLLIRPNSRRRLKTRSAQRVIPLSYLMPEVELELLLRWRDRRVEQNKANPELGDDLFLLEKTGKIIRDNDPFMELLTDALQKATHDSSFRFHHLRHSFANWQLVKFWFSEQKCTHPLPKWFLNAEHESNRWFIAPGEREAILGKSPTNRRSLMQVSRLLGHSSVDITLAHYVHLLDFLAGRTLRRMTPKLKTSALVAITGYSESHVRYIRRESKCDEFQGDDENAIELELFIDKCWADGQHPKEAPISKGKVDFSRRPEKASPKTAMGHLYQLAEALNILSKESCVIEEISLQYGIDKQKLQRALKGVDSLPSEIVCRSVKEERGGRFHSVDFPKGEQQKELANNTIETMEALMTKGDGSSHGIRTIQNRLRKTIQHFIQHWVKGSYLCVHFNTLPEAKNWLWFLEQLKLKDGIIALHAPCKENDARSVSGQKNYWEKALKVKLGDLKVEQEIEQSRGCVQIKVDLRKLANDIQPYNKVTALYGVRFALVMWWLTRN